MQRVAQGRSIDLDLILKDSSGALVDPISLKVDINRPNGVPDIIDLSPSRLRQGAWRYTLSVGSAIATGIWSATWHAVMAGGSTYESTDVFEIVEAGAPFGSSSTTIDRFERGKRIPVDAVFYIDNQPVDVTAVSVSVTDPVGNPVTISETPTELREGVWRGWWNIPYNALRGVYIASWTGTYDGVTVGFESPFEIVSESLAAPSFSAGIDRVPSGGIRSFDAVFRTANGLLWDPDDSQILIVDPNGVTVVAEQPDRLTTGVYRYTTPLGVVGFWILDWSGENDAITADFKSIVEVVATELVDTSLEDQHPFGASISGVRALLAHQAITSVTQPNIVQVERFIDDIAAIVSLRIGPYATAIVDQNLVERITAMAKVVVETGAASIAQDAAHPAKALPNLSEYGGELWTRYQLLLDQLVAVVNNATPGDDPGAGNTGGGAVYSEPPVFGLWMRQ